MASITITVPDADLPLLEAAARQRGVDISGGWEAFYTAHHADAIADVRRAIGERVAADPALTAQMLALMAAPPADAGGEQ